MAYTGKLQLFRGIPLDINSEDTFYFSSTSAQSNYFDNLPVATRVTFSAEDFKFVREGYVKVNRNHEFIESCNYLRYQNENLDEAYPTYEKKWYYAFITGIEYINDTTSGVYFKIDAMQTWLPNVDYDVNECFVERNHSTTDGIGDNVATEPLKAYKNKYYEENDITIKSRYYYIGILFIAKETFLSKIQVEINHNNADFDYTTILGTNKTDNTVSGANVALFKVQPTSGYAEDDGLDELRKALKQGATVASGGAYLDDTNIISMFIIPDYLVDEDTLVTLNGTDLSSTVWTGYTFPNRIVEKHGVNWQDYDLQTKAKSIDPNFSLTGIGSYTPANKKLLTSQYVNYEVVNIDGNSAQYEPEGITDGSGNVIAPLFRIMTTALPPNKIIIAPIINNSRKYYGSEIINQQMLDVGNMPSVTAKISTYEAWLVKQTVQQIQMLMPTSLIASSFTPANFVDPKLVLAQEGLANQMKNTGGSFDVAEYVARRKQIHQLEAGEKARSQLRNDKTEDINYSGNGSIIRTACNLLTMERPTPITAGSVSDSGSVLNAHQLLKISIRKKAPIEAELERIDDYFTAYGYAQYKLTKPHIKVRNRYTYVKTIGARMTPRSTYTSVVPGIPANYMLEINNRFDAGIRFWVGQDIGRLKDTSTSKNTILPSSDWDN